MLTTFDRTKEQEISGSQHLKILVSRTTVATAPLRLKQRLILVFSIPLLLTPQSNLHQKHHCHSTKHTRNQKRQSPPQTPEPQTPTKHPRDDRPREECAHGVHHRERCEQRPDPAGFHQGAEEGLNERCEAGAEGVDCESLSDCCQPITSFKGSVGILTESDEADGWSNRQTHEPQNREQDARPRHVQVLHLRPYTDFAHQKEIQKRQKSSGSEELCEGFVGEEKVCLLGKNVSTASRFEGIRGTYYGDGNVVARRDVLEEDFEGAAGEFQEEGGGDEGEEGGGAGDVGKGLCCRCR